MAMKRFVSLKNPLNIGPLWRKDERFGYFEEKLTNKSRNLLVEIQMSDLFETNEKR